MDDEDKNCFAKNMCTHRVEIHVGKDNYRRLHNLSGCYVTAVMDSKYMMNNIGHTRKYTCTTRALCGKTCSLGTHQYNRSILILTVAN